MPPPNTGQIDAPPAPRPLESPPPRGPAWRRGLPRLLFESGLIVLSILLAFVLNEWREDRRTAGSVRAAVVSFRTELEANLREVESTLAYHEQVAASLGALVGDDAAMGALGGRPVLDVIAPMIPRGILPPELRSIAWQTALARGVLADMDYALVARLAAVYEVQRVGVESTWPRIVDVIFDPGFHDPGRTREILLFLHLAVRELAAQERELAATYSTTLEALPR